MLLRPATPDDAETFFTIRCAVRENHYSREELAALGITPERVAEMLRSGDYISTIAEMDGRPVGITMAQLSAGFIEECFVLPEYEGRGVGRAVMAAAEQGLRAAGVTQAWLSTGPTPDIRAMGFYRHLGWKEDGLLEDGQVRFIKELAPRSVHGI